MDDKSKTGKRDDSRINVNESYELQYWSEKFNVTTDQLKQAVQAVGTQATAVAEYLSSKK
jgi:hypothetical protein